MSFYIDPEDPEIYFPSVIMERGASYYASGAIRNLAQSDNGTWVAEVEGTETYLVTIKPVDDGLFNCRCTCPYAYDAPCKHIAAVMMAVEDESDISSVQEAEANPSSSSLANPIDEMLNRSEKETLAEFIRKMAAEDPHFKNQFLSFMTPTEPGAGKPQFRKLIKSALAPARRKGLVFSNEARRMLSPVYELLERADELNQSGSPETAMAISQVVVEEMVPAFQFIDDSYADVGEAVQWAIDLLHELAGRHLEEKEQKQFFNWCIKSIDDERYEGWDFPDDFIAMGVNLAGAGIQAAKMEDLLDNRIEQSSKKPDHWSSTYRLETSVLQKARLFRKFGREEEADALLNRFKMLTRVRDQMIETAWGRGEPETVKTLAEDAIKSLGKSAPGLIPGWQRWLIRVYETRKDDGKVQEWLEALLINEPTMVTYAKLKKIWPADHWPGYLHETLIPNLSAGNRGSYLLPEIYALEKMWDQLLDYLKKNPNFFTLKRYGQYFTETALDEIYELYETLIRNYLEQNTGRKNYRKMCDELKHLYNLGAEEQALKLSDALCDLYSNRPALVEEFGSRFKAQVAR